MHIGDGIRDPVLEVAAEVVEISVGLGFVTGCIQEWWGMWVHISGCRCVHIVVVVVFECPMLICVVALICGSSWVVSVCPCFIAPIV